MLLSLTLASSLLLASDPRGVEDDVQEPADYREAAAGRRVALVVGINEYEDPELTDLRFAAKDALDVTEVLRDQDIGGFSVRRLPPDATRDQILRAFADVTSSLQGDDTFLFYFAGHGTKAIESNRAELYLLPSDARLIREESEREARMSSWLSMDELEDLVEAVPARSRVVVVDACYYGDGRSQLSPVTQQELRSWRGESVPERRPQPQWGDAFLFAAHEGQPAREDEELENGVFTHFFVEALAEQGDTDGDNLVDIEEVYRYVVVRTEEHTQRQQTPWMQRTVFSSSTIYLAGREEDRERADRVMFYNSELSYPSLELRLNDDLIRGAYGSVTPGAHDVEIRQGGQVLVRGPFNFQAGQRVDLVELVDQRQASYLVGVGGALTTPYQGLDTVQRWSVLGQATWWPADLGGPRLGVSLSASYSWGEVGSAQDPGYRGELHTGDVQLRLTRAWGQTWLKGPSLGVGYLWRDTSGMDVRGSPIVAPGLSVTRLQASTFFSLDASLRYIPYVWEGETTPRGMPTLSAVFGVRL